MEGEYEKIRALVVRQYCLVRSYRTLVDGLSELALQCCCHLCTLASRNATGLHMHEATATVPWNRLIFLGGIDGGGLV